MPSKTPSPYRRPWSNTETTALPRSYHVPSIHTMEGIVRNLSCRAPRDNRAYRSKKGGYEPAGDRTRDLRIKSPLLYQLSYRLARRKIVGEVTFCAYVSADQPNLQRLRHRSLGCDVQSHGKRAIRCVVPR